MGRGVVKKWRAEIEEQGFIPCAICGLEIRSEKISVLGELTIDHIIPISLGGTNSADNLQPAHRKCNSHKANSDNYTPTDKHTKRIDMARRLLDKKSH